MSHRLVATINASTAKEAAQQLQALPQRVSMAELRLDALWRTPPEPDAATEDLVTILDAAHTPLLATLRPTRQGGAFQGPEDVRLNLLAAAATAGFAAVDLETDNAELPKLIRAMRQHGGDGQVFLSHHAYEEAPERDLAMRHLTAQQDLGADLHKLAFPTPTFPDYLRALELAHAHAGRYGQPAIAPMRAPLLIRALLPLAGNAATYGHAPGAPPAAPGQPDAAALLAAWDHWGLDHTDLGPRPEGNRWLCVVGAPVDHSLSPRIHNAALKASGKAIRYGALDVPSNPGYLRLLFIVASRIGLAGCSVTTPHKLEAARLADADAIATNLGAANCVRFTPTGPVATNTDATALRRLLEPYKGQPAAVLGTGGAARAALWALRELGMEATAFSRDEERGRAVAKRFGATWLPYSQRDTLRPAIWIQATPIGSKPDDECPLSEQALQSATAVVEMVYASGQTALERAAEQAGCAVTSGKQVLLEQGVDAYRYWFDEEPDRSAMEGALAAPA